MLARLEFFGGLFLVAFLCLLAGYAVVSEILTAHPGSQVRDCVARSAAVAAANGKPVSERFLTKLCERLKPEDDLFK